MARFSRIVACIAAGIAVSLLWGSLLPSWGYGTVSPPVATVTAGQVGDQRYADTPSPRVAPLPIAPEPSQSPGFVLPSGLPSPSADPADQIAPPGLEVQPGDRPITPFMSISMRRELNSLVGRVESALVAAAAADQPVDIRLEATTDVLVASGEGLPVEGAQPMAHPVLVEAKQLMQDWPGLIRNRAYGEARDRWLAVRQELWDNFPTDRAFAQPEIRAMWLDRGSIVRAGSAENLAIVFDHMAEAGINTVFFETVNASYPIYPSRVAPLQNPLTRRWDPLAAAVELAHERHMELHAWMWVFAAGNQRHNDILNLPTGYLGPVLNAHKDWGAFDNEGSPIPKGQAKPFFDPANPEARAYLLQLVDEIISNYAVDGLQLDYIRYPFQDPGAERTYGYGKAARQQFQALTGVDPVDLTPRVDPWLDPAERSQQLQLWQQWTDFRIAQVTGFVEETSALVRRKRPDVLLSTAVFPMPEHERLQKIQQDWGTWAQQGLVDWVILMSYARDTNRLEQLVEPWVLDQDYGSTLLIPGIRLLNLSVPAMIDQMQALRDLPVPGYALFASDNLDQRLRTVLNSTQGHHGDWVPQQVPYEAAAKRFGVLQREWNWLLSNQQMVLEPKLADDWIAQINGLGQALSDLAPEVAPGDVAAVKEQVEALKRDLAVGMRLQTATTPEYRLQAWENRLESIRRFLAYGLRQNG